MPNNLIYTDWHSFFWLTGPLLVVFGAMVVILLMGAFMKVAPARSLFIVSLLAIVVSFLMSWSLWVTDPNLTVGMMRFDRLSFLGWMVVLMATLFTLLLSHHYVVTRDAAKPEYYALLLLSVIGVGVFLAGNDLITVFLGLEIMSIPLYALTGFLRRRGEANEAALKYFLTGAFASAFLLMGIAFLFGSAGTTDLARLSTLQPSPYALLGASLLLIGFCFKIAAVPFHAWAPDAYEGAPTPITNFMATAVKAAAIFALLRVGMMAIPLFGSIWSTGVAWLAVATMTVGNLAAISQESVKRMLAYSSIAHAGYMLVGFPTLLTTHGVASVTFYVISYVFMTTGAFAILIAIQGGTEGANISRFAGLSRKRPWMAAMLALFLISLTGFPPTLGFFAKYYLFLNTVKGGMTWLVVIALLNSAVSAYYYLRPVVAMYFHPPRGEEIEIEPAAPAIVAVIAITALAVLLFGLFPQSLLAIVERSGG